MSPLSRLAAVLAAVLVLSACTTASDIYAPIEPAVPRPSVGGGELVPSVERPDIDWSARPDAFDGVTRLAYTDGDQFVLQTGGGDRTFLPGVNLGSTVPGRAPGEVAVAADDYRRWFPLMADVGFRVIRVYTILRPAFYEELAAYNLAHPESPLYLMQGVWVPEESYFTEPDLFHPSIQESFAAELTDAVAVVHGDAELEERPGHASGTYATDVSEWLVGWLVGVEWEPELTRESDDANLDRPLYSGEFFENVEGASPTAIWLAEALDHLATEQIQRGKIMPIGFVNWPTTDPLVHPFEPDPAIDLVNVDANDVRPTDQWSGGYFASYHVYPYYPDFIHLEPGLVDFEYQGEIDPYAGYLTALADHHSEMPVLVTEFGVPAGMALARIETHGRHQGFHSEQNQMAINAELLATIHDLGLGGGFVFEWIDEWFKLTWNTADYEIPADRRPMWQNTWTNESQFGVLATVPGTAPAVIVDGEDREWVANGSKVIYDEAESGLQAVRATNDEAFLYLLLEFDDPGILDEPVTIGIDVLWDQGWGLPDSGLDPAADYAVVLGPGHVGQLLVRADNDPYTARYGLFRRYFDVGGPGNSVRPGQWNPQRLLVRRPLEDAGTGEIVPVVAFETGNLMFGTTDPADPAFDSRVVWSASEGTIEIRLPYMAIGFSDPSTLQAYRVDLRDHVTTEEVSHVGISVVVGDQAFFTDGISWDPWTTVEWHDRPKAGIDVFADAVWEIVLDS